MLYWLASRIECSSRAATSLRNPALSGGGLLVRGCVCLCECVCATHVCFRTESRISLITAPWGDRLPFSSSPPATCGFPPKWSFPHSSFPPLSLADSLSSFLFSVLHIPTQFQALLLCCLQPGYLAESPPGSSGYNVGLVSEAGDLLRWAAVLAALR